jgi:microcystin-dependent protein
MSTPFLGEVRMFSFPFAPKGWAMCNGQILSIQQNAALFSILGTTFGGNGTTTFALPNMQGRVPTHWGTSPSYGTVTLGQQFGQESHTLLLSEVPSHTHLASGSSDMASLAGPVNNLVAVSAQNPYAPALTNPVTLQPGTVALAGGSQPHENRQPFLVVNACIALAGVFPQRN